MHMNTCSIILVVYAVTGLDIDVLIVRIDLVLKTRDTRPH